MLCHYFTQCDWQEYGQLDTLLPIYIYSYILCTLDKSNIQVATCIHMYKQVHAMQTHTKAYHSLHAI